MNLSRPQRGIFAFAVGFVLLVLLLSLGPIGQVAYAQATDTPTPTLTRTPTSTRTPTLTPTPTNTPTTTPFPVDRNQLLGSLLCRNPQRDCIQSRNGGGLHFYGANGGLTLFADAATGNITSGGSISASGNVTVTGQLSANTISSSGNITVTGDISTTGKLLAPNYEVCGIVPNVVGTAVAPHGMPTPGVVIVSLAEDATGDASHVTYGNAGGVVSLKVWNSALTPAPNTTPAAVSWCVYAP